MTEANRIQLPGVFRVEGAIVHAASFAFVGSPYEDGVQRPMTDAEFARYTERRARGESPSWTYAVE